MLLRAFFLKENSRVNSFHEMRQAAKCVLLAVSLWSKYIFSPPIYRTLEVVIAQTAHQRNKPVQAYLAPNATKYSKSFFDQSI